MNVSKYFIAAFSLLLLPFSFVQAAQPGDLVKGSLSSVYYLGQDGKRYVFSNEQVYKTWYADFSSVKTISDSELASYLIGGNVTYRPGVRMVKIDSVPNVYAVARGGQLRWVETEAIATSLYGTNWAKQIDDIAPSSFTDYRSGANISSLGMYSSDTERAMALTIQDELNAKRDLANPTTPTTTSPVPTSTSPTTPTSTSSTPPVSLYTGSISVTPSKPKNGDTVNISTPSYSPGSIYEIRLFQDNQFVQQCAFAPCTRQLILNTSSNTILRAEFRWITGQTYTVSSTVMMAPGISGVSLEIPRPEIRPFQPRDINLFVDNREGTYVKADILLNGSLIKTCSGTQISECRSSEIEQAATGTTHTVVAELTNTVGMTKRTEIKTISVVANERPLVSLTTSKTSVLRNEQIEVTARAQDPDPIARIDIRLDGSIIKTCENALTCSAIVGPWNQSRALEFTASAIDQVGMTGYGTSSTVTVQ